MTNPNFQSNTQHDAEPVDDESYLEYAPLPAPDSPAVLAMEAFVKNIQQKKQTNE